MAVAEALGPLSESERSKLSKHAEMLLKECNQYADKYWAIQHGEAKRSPVMERLFGDDNTRCRTTVRAAEVAAFALCPLSIVRKVDCRDKDVLIDVLLVRRPEWIDDWLDVQFKKEMRSIGWKDYWRLYKSGVCSKPSSNEYYRFQVGAVSSEKKLSDLLTEEPELLNDAWKLFEVETWAFAFDGPDPPGRESWASAFCRLAERGTIDRGRLLDATLKGLTTGFKKDVLTGFSKFHDRLEPTVDEMSERQATYADLLNVKTEQVVAFAMTMLKKVDQAKRLDDELFVGAAPSVFAMPTKARAKSALDLLQKIGKRSPELRPQIIANLVDSALVHPVSDIVTTALEMVATWRESLTPEIARRLAEVEVPLASQALLRELVAERSSSSEDVQATADAAAAENTSTLADAGELDAHWRQLAGVDEAAAAIEGHRWPGPLRFRWHDVPVLSGVQPVTPIRSIEEIRDALAHCAEVVDAPLDVERIVDGISRLGRDVSESFERLAAPLIKRIRQLAESWAPRNLVIYGRTPIGLVRLVQWWLNDRQAADGSVSYYCYCLDPPSDAAMLTPILNFLDRRYRDLLQRLVAGHQGPLLSMPTHDSGWIDPLVFVDRWRESLEQGVPILKTDAVLGMLRLAPDHRAAALQTAAEISHPWMASLRWALGEPCAPPKIEGDQADFWIAAANARGDDESFAALRAAGLDGAGPDGSLRSAYQWQANMRESKDRNSGATRVSANIDVTVPLILPPIDATLDRPSVFLHAKNDSPYWREAQWMISYLATVSPGNVSAQIASGITALITRLDSSALASEPNEPYIRPLFDVDRPLDDLACLLLLVGLCSKDEDVRRLSIDAAVESIQDGRLHPAILGPTLARLAVPDWLKLNRLCANLDEIARVSSMHAWVVCESLDPLLAAYQELPRDAHHLLALLQELLLQLGGELSTAAKQPLAAFAGGGKSGKLAKALLKLTASESPAAAEARQQLLQARIERAQRWQGAQYDSADQNSSEQVLQRS